MADVYNSKFVSEKIYKLNTVDFILDMKTEDMQKIKDINDRTMVDFYVEENLKKEQESEQKASISFKNHESEKP